MPSMALYIVLCSGEHEKIQMAAMMASVGAVSERQVEVFVSMNAILAFAKSAPAETRYHGGSFSKLTVRKSMRRMLLPVGLTKFLSDAENGQFVTL